MASRIGAIPILALDVPTASEGLELVEYFGDRCGFYKVGNELFTAAGPGMVRELSARHKSVFVDLKFHDIPNTVAGGVRNAAELGARLVTVHAAGGLTMVQKAVEAAGESCGVLAVTVLTSLTAPELADAWGRSAESLVVEAEVLRLAELAARAGAHGIVCSGREAELVKREFGDRLSILVPGVRGAGAAVQDQARVVTPAEAAAAGARYIVVGRMVTAAADRRGAMDTVNAMLGDAGAV
jgi:orotidine-5'-phosphate decarboxylase